MNQQELNEVLRLHQLWIEGNPEGKNANLEGAYLKGAYLVGANLIGANLEGANLSNANLSYANLEGARLESANLFMTSLEGANLAGASLFKTNLYKATLEGTNLKNSILWDTLGNCDEIRTIQTNYYIVNITKDIVQIGCKAFTWKEWLAFTDKDILDLDGQKALEFWSKYKDYIQLSIDLSGF